MARARRVLVERFLAMTNTETGLFRNSCLTYMKKGRSFNTRMNKFIQSCREDFENELGKVVDRAKAMEFGRRYEE